MIQTEHEDLAVADLSGLCRSRDGLDDLVDLSGWAGDFDFDLGQEAHGIFGAAIDFGVALLPPIALDLGDGQALDADFGKRIADLVELEWLDDCHHDFHWNYSPRRRQPVTPLPRNSNRVPVPKIRPTD